MNIVLKKIDEIIPYERNTKKHDETQITNVAESIKKYGFVQPIVIDKDDVVVIGHCRLLGAQRLGMEEVPCVCVDSLTPEQVNALRIVDNKTNESPWDFELLVEEFENIDISDFDFDFGFNVNDTAYEPEPFDEELLEEYKEHENDFLLKKRVIITYKANQESELCNFLGMKQESLKVVYDFDELMENKK